MKTTRRKFTAKFKAQVAIEAIKERESMTDLAWPNLTEPFTGRIDGGYYSSSIPKRKRQFN